MASFSLKAMAGAVFFGLCAVAPASAQVDVFDEVLSTIGITGKQRPNIDYRERAPLVVPPSGSGLRPPEQRPAVANGRWPNDPDVEERRRAAALRAGVPQYGAGDNTTSAGIIRDGNKVRNRYAGVPTAGTYTPSGEVNPARALSPEQVAEIMANGPEGAATQPGVDPGRRSLTEPPRGYRAAQGGLKIKSTIDPMRNTDAIEINVNAPKY